MPNTNGISLASAIPAIRMPKTKGLTMREILALAQEIVKEK